MKYSEIALLTKEELNEKLKSERDMLSKLKFAHSLTPIENPMKIRTSRRLVAQLSTELTNRSKTV